jgi:sugar lactone lactonase YvrE
MKRLLFSIILLLLVAAAGWADGTQTWEQSRYDDFEKGTATGIAIRSEGALELAPQFRQLYTSPSSYIWSLASDGAGNAYAAAGSPARVYRMQPDGTATVIFEPKELQVQALLEREGALYAATSPDGKVYKLEPSGAGEKTGGTSALWKSSIFFEPHTKYIWAMAMDQAGQLYVATGDQGQIFKITKDGQGSVLFQSDDANIRSLTIDGQGNLIAGTDGSGVVYRISPSGEAFALYSADKKEITALAVDSRGSIYAAGVGEKRASSVPAMIAVPPPSPAAPSVPNAAAPPAALSLGMFFSPASGIAAGSEIYKIAPDGSPTLLWSSPSDLVYALAFDQENGAERLLAGTGNKGRLVAIGANGRFTDLLKASANQITSFAPAPNGGLYVATSNLGKIFSLGPGLATSGKYESDVFDAHLFSRWGRAEVRGQGDFELRARSGNVENPDRNWSPWTKVDFNLSQGPVLQVPAARFVQWQVMMKAGERLPRVESVIVNYLSKNVAPVVDDVEVQVGSPDAQGKPGNAPSVGAANSAPQTGDTATPAAPHDHNTVTVHWTAHDDNHDELAYSLFYRGDNEDRWLPLTHEKITEKSYTFDAGLLPDGGYTIKVVTSDAPSHSPQEALSGENESARFEIDTTPPRVEELRAAAQPNGSLHVSFRGVDGFSAIHRAEYSVDAGDWQFVAPVGEISDSTTESYDFTIPATDAAKSSKSNAEHVIAVRVYDRFDNVGSGKVVVK